MEDTVEQQPSIEDAPEAKKPTAKVGKKKATKVSKKASAAAKAKEPPAKAKKPSAKSANKFKAKANGANKKPDFVMDSFEENSSLSSGKVCHCGDLVYNQQKAPLSMEIMMFLQLMRTALVNCALCGSAVLAEIIYQNTKCFHCSSSTQWKIQERRANSDIDFFVHRFPSELNEYYGQPVHHFYTKEGEFHAGFYARFISHILPWFNQVMGDGVMGLLKVTGHTGRYNLSDYYNIAGIYEIIELGFENGGQKLQIIVLDRLPELKEDWSSFVSSCFDIDIVRTFVRNVYEGTPMVGFTDEQAAESFWSCSFIYTIRPAESFERGFSRMCKYLQRGFSIKQIQFDSRLLPFWKQYWMGRFSLLFSKTWTAELLESAIRRQWYASDAAEKYELIMLQSRIEANNDVSKLIGEFLWTPPRRHDYNKMMMEQRALEVQRQRLISADSIHRHHRPFISHIYDEDSNSEEDASEDDMQEDEETEEEEEVEEEWDEEMGTEDDSENSDDEEEPEEPMAFVNGSGSFAAS